MAAIDIDVSLSLKQYIESVARLSLARKVAAGAEIDLIGSAGEEFQLLLRAASE